MRLVSFKIAENSQEWGKIAYEDSGELSQILMRLDRNLIEREGVNLFRRRHMKIFEDHGVHIIKPAEARFWTESRGFHDADETIAQSIAGTSDGIS